MAVIQEIWTIKNPPGGGLGVMNICERLFMVNYRPLFGFLRALGLLYFHLSQEKFCGYDFLLYGLQIYLV